MVEDENDVLELSFKDILKPKTEKKERSGGGFDWSMFKKPEDVYKVLQLGVQIAQNLGVGKGVPQAKPSEVQYMPSEKATPQAEPTQQAPQQITPMYDMIMLEVLMLKKAGIKDIDEGIKLINDNIGMLEVMGYAIDLDGVFKMLDDNRTTLEPIINQKLKEVIEDGKEKIE